MKQEALADALNQAGKPLRRCQALLPVLWAAAGGLGCFAVAAWILRVGKDDSGVLVLITWGLATLLVLSGFAMGWRNHWKVGPHQIATELEKSGSWRDGALRGLLVPATRGTSITLRTLAEEQSREAVLEHGSDALSPQLHNLRMRLRRSSLWMAAAVLLLLSARPGDLGTSLWNPRLAWAAVAAPLELEASAREVLRGEPVELHLKAVGYRSAHLLWRLPGEEWRDTLVVLDRNGEASLTTAPLDAELSARLLAGGRQSDEVKVGVRLPMFVEQAVLTAKYPAYLKREQEQLALLGDTLLIPVGTRLLLRGTLSDPADDVILAGPDSVLKLTTQARLFQGEWVPTRSGSWRLQRQDTIGVNLLQIPLLLLQDSVPEAAIVVPGADLTAPVSLQLELLISLRDDHGLEGAALEFRRSGGQETNHIKLDLDRAVTDQALLRARVDLSLLGLKPGDTLFYQAVARDNSPVRQVGRSSWWAVRIPTESEARVAVQAGEKLASSGLDSLVESSRQLERRGEELSRERPRNSAANAADSTSSRLSAEAAGRVGVMVAAQEQLLAGAEKIERQLEQLRRSRELAGAADSASNRQISDIRDLIRRANSPELRAALEKLQDALQRLDAEATRDALQNLAQRQAEYRSALEQARELFRHAAEEEELRRLENTAGQLGVRQRELTAELMQAARKPSGDSAGLSIARQDSLARVTDSLAAAIDSAGQQLSSGSSPESMRRSAESTRKAAAEMREAAKAAQRGQEEPVEQHGKAAEKQLASLESEIRNGRTQLQQQLRDEVLKELDRSLAETVQLTGRQLELSRSYQQGLYLSAARDVQARIDDALGRLLTQISRVAGRNALVPQQIGISLTTARARMRQAVEHLSSIIPDGGAAAVESNDAVDALTLAGFSMLRARERVSGSQSGSGMQEALEELQQAIAAQAKAAGESGERPGGGGSTIEQMLRMAAQQQAVATQLNRLRVRGDIPGAGMLADEAAELARQLEAGNLDPEILRRQQKLYQRMLDAGRRLQGEEADDEVERKAVTAGQQPARTPASLDPAVLKSTNLLELLRWDILQKLPSAERRRVMDYFQRLMVGNQ